MATGDLTADTRTVARKRRRRGPPAKLSRQRIADAVLEVGFERLTVAAVARQLGVAAGGLYRYVNDRDDLVIAAADRLFATMPRSTATEWTTFLRDEAAARWDALTAHPGIIRAVRATGRTSTQPRQRLVWLVHELVDRGLAPPDAMLAADTVVDLVHDGAQQYESLKRAGDDLERLAPRSFATPLFVEQISIVRSDPAAFFGRKLDAALAGLEVIIGDAVGKRPTDA